jgi:hypothetical protein
LVELEGNLMVFALNGKALRRLWISFGCLEKKKRGEGERVVKEMITIRRVLSTARPH